MSGIQQSGNVTPGHVGLWTTDGVQSDGGPYVGTSEHILGQLLGANFNSTLDQQIALPASASIVHITRIIIANPSISLTTAVGGFYPTVSKGGTPLVAATQVYSTLTGATKLLNATLASYANTTAFTSAILTAFSVFFALTTAQGAAATADIYVAGLVLQ